MPRRSGLANEVARGARQASFAAMAGQCARPLACCFSAAASGMNAYAMTDRATWIAFENKGDLEIAVEGDDRLFNQYGIILVNKEKCPKVKAGLGQQFIDWVLSDEGQQAIADYKKNGQQLFFPNAKTS